MSTLTIPKHSPKEHNSAPQKFVDSDLAHRKPCTICRVPRPVLVRCQIDSSGIWHFICPGACWRGVSGGEIDGDGSAQRRFYRYGGMWKNKHEGVSAKKPRKVKKDPREVLMAKEGASIQPVLSASDEMQEVAQKGEENQRKNKNIDKKPGRKWWAGDDKRFSKNDGIEWDPEVEYILEEP